MQFINDTDEPIVLRPGEGISGSIVTRSYDGRMYRATLKDIRGTPSDAGELPDGGDFREQDRNRLQQVLRQTAVGEFDG